jgi:maltoporin
MPSKFLLFFYLIFSASCHNNAQSPILPNNAIVLQDDKNENPYKFVKDIPLPDSFKRIEVESNSFGEYLRNIELKKDKTVYKYDGTLKGNQSAHIAVLNISVGNKNLQQCADAVMRLRAEYLFAQKRFREINFIDNEGKQYQFSAPFTQQNFTPYLERVFGMCGSASLTKQLHAVASFDKINIGDIIIRGGFPGHAVQVMDMAVNSSGQKIYLLAQGFMPAQDIHILKNFTNNKFSPWYLVNENDVIETPEYNFTNKELKSW